MDQILATTATVNLEAELQALSERFGIPRKNLSTAMRAWFVGDLLDNLTGILGLPIPVREKAAHECTLLLVGAITLSGVELPKGDLEALVTELDKLGQRQAAFMAEQAAKQLAEQAAAPASDLASILTTPLKH